MSIFALWLPILLSAVIVFLVSAVIHMVFTYHQSDFGKLADEDGVMDALRGFNIPPGNYVIPCAGSAKAMNSPEFVDKAKKGPVAFMTVMPSGIPSMAASLTQWFVYSIVIGIFAAYIGSRTLAPGAHYLDVFRYVGTTAFAGYALALLQNAIWYKHSWSMTLKSMFDGLIYALMTAGTFGWLWPGA